MCNRLCIATDISACDVQDGEADTILDEAPADAIEQSTPAILASASKAASLTAGQLSDALAEERSSLLSEPGMLEQQRKLEMQQLSAQLTAEAATQNAGDDGRSRQRTSASSGLSLGSTTSSCCHDFCGGCSLHQKQRPRDPSCSGRVECEQLTPWRRESVGDMLAAPCYMGFAVIFFNAYVNHAGSPTGRWAGLWLVTGYLICATLSMVSWWRRSSWASALSVVIITCMAVMRAVSRWPYDSGSLVPATLWILGQLYLGSPAPRMKLCLGTFAFCVLAPVACIMSREGMADDLLWMVMVTATHHLLVLQSDAAMRSVTTSKVCM
eukprot:TRINITY_DN4036_c1_g1_i7.p1 TRINITY_DN4036_c1_g1~~TRINITY_DN4036_c1_g1_i7.p1  ORF type:complete len:325 (+),score=36.54 TRINITY_DN4036_c1_g1_i7:239-1213(+)